MGRRNRGTVKNYIYQRIGNSVLDIDICAIEELQQISLRQCNIVVNTKDIENIQKGDKTGSEIRVQTYLNCCYNNITAI